MPSADAGTAVITGSNAAAATVKAVFFRADTIENVQGVDIDADPGGLIGPIFRVYGSGTRTDARTAIHMADRGAIADRSARRSGRLPAGPGCRRPEGAGDTETMKLNRPVSWFLLAFGVWSWFIWITFVKNLWQDGSGLAFDDAGDPTGYFWVHLTLAIVSFLLGTAVGVIGFRGVRALRREQREQLG
ncbi:hypothetical protein Y717_11865 [Streptomyces scopuliridis RB72]|uniref:Uncharacterized protein n=2 Tax=Streptomyces scopuliridis TaxID=452529 RepID=A0A2T7SNE6_9ACTN|nr:hypothetical protein Y717_11865 [Streptomyces scopuliridis RB72]